MFPFTPHFRRIWPACALFTLFLTALVGTSCSSNTKPPKYFTQFYMEAPVNSGMEFTLPVSGLKYRRQPQPFLTSADVNWVKPGTVNVQGVTTPCVFFQLTIQGQHELYIHTGNNVGRRIFLFANDKPVGVRYIDDVLQNDPLFVFLEVDPKKYDEFVQDLQDSQQQVVDLKKKL